MILFQLVGEIILANCNLSMKKFVNLKPNESIGLDVAIYKNALQLKKDAVLIAKTRQSYSSATSLLILSSEEVIKSILVLLHANKFEVYKLKDSHKFFFDHKIRHQIAQLIEMGIGVFQSVFKYGEQEPSKFLNTKYDLLNTIVNGIVNIANAAKPLLDSTNRVRSLKGFNELKNKGFYVDYKDGLVLPQKEMDEALYLETLYLCERIFTFSKGLRILFHENLQHRISIEEINSGKEALKNLMTTLLKDFSFKEFDKAIS